MVEAGSSKAAIEDQIKNTPVLVFSKSTCPFAAQTKKLIGEKGISAKVVELNQIADGAAVQAMLKVITGQGTVPNVFIGGKHIGGNSELQALHKQGGLKKALDAINVENTC